MQISDSLLDIATAKKREYLSDFEKFTSVISLKNISYQLLKGGLVTFSLGLMEYNLVLDRNIRLDFEAEEGDEIELEEFDWKLAEENAIKRFQEYSARFFFSSLIRKVYEEIVHLNFSARLTDRLTKDISKSMIRKFQRIPNRLEACKKLFRTSMHSRILMYTSSATYDAFLELRDTYLNKRSISILDSAKWIAKKSTAVVLYILFASTGVAIGAYFDAPSVCEFAFDCLGSYLVGVLITF